MNLKPNCPFYLLNQSLRVTKNSNLEDTKDSRIFYLFNIKCNVVSSDVVAELGSLIFMQNRL